MQDLPETNPYPRSSRSYLAYECAYDLFMSLATFHSMCGRILEIGILCISMSTWGLIREITFLLTQ